MSDFQQEHMEALNALRDQTKKLSPEQEAKINSLLDVQEAKSQAKFKELQEKVNRIEELEKQYNSLEADLKRNLGGDEKQAKTQELKAFEELLIKGSAKMLINPEVKFLRQGDNTDGGYLAPAEYANEIIKKIIT